MSSASLGEIQAYIRVAAPQGRETLRVGPFLATFDPGTALVYLSYAIPDDGAAPSSDDVSSLVAAYVARSRVPRLEYIPALAPLVEPLLLAAGFEVEARVPMMVCDPSFAVPQPVPAGIELLVPRTDDELTGYVRAQREAFGEDPAVSSADLERMRGRDGLFVLARDVASGEPAGAGAGTTVIGGSTELAGLGVREPYRRRGIAAAITWELSRLAVAAGVTTAFLTPGDGVAERVYARVGYRSVGEMLHISHPGAA
jgi:GNAT superfamily N-acetyltransferase